MIKKTVDLSKTDLRQQAEAQLKKNKKGKTSAPVTAADALRLVHELQVHQIELEMQNEELAQARGEAEALLSQFTDLYDFAPVGYFTLARGGVIEQANLTGASLLGVERGKLIQRRFGLFVGPKSRKDFNAFLEKVFTGDAPETCEVDLLKNKTEALWAHIEAISDATDETCRAVVVDITERKQAEEEIRQLNASLEQRVEERTQELRAAQEHLIRNEKLAVLGQMAGSVGHELRNPLGVISNAVYFLKLAQPDAPEKVKEYLNLIQKNINISDKIVSDLLDFTRVKPLDRAPISIPDVLQQTLERFPPPENIQVELDLPAVLPKAYADPQHVIQVLGNLTLNACQAMKEGGKLTVSSKQSSVGSDQSSVGSKQSSVGSDQSSVGSKQSSVKTESLTTDH
jgi:PAS domain S-box-containing protein